jgi:hypothetical protein
MLAATPRGVDKMTWLSSQACQNGIALLSLIIAAIGLRFLVSSVRATKVIAEQSIAQSEATSRPAGGHETRANDGRRTHSG